MVNCRGFSNGNCDEKVSAENEGLVFLVERALGSVEKIRSSDSATELKRCQFAAEIVWLFHGFELLDIFIPCSSLIVKWVLSQFDN